MPYGIASREEVRQQRAKIHAARQAANFAQNFTDWNVARAEAKACGYEFPSFNEWLGESNAKDQAVNRYMAKRDENNYFID